MSSQTEIKDCQLRVPIEPIIQSMTLEAKREMLSWLATDEEVIQSVIAHITGKDDLGWSSGDPDRSQKILASIEESSLKSGVRYNWGVWSAAKQKIKDIRSTEHLYWVLYHKLSPDLSHKVMDELRTLGVESNYTTEQANTDIEEVRKTLDEALKGMGGGEQ